MIRLSPGAAALATAGLLGAGIASAAPLTLNGTVRDFSADGVNFEGPVIGLQTGLVGTTLSGASPTLTASGAGQISNTGAGAFDNWYTKTTDTMALSLTLTEKAGSPGVYQYSNSSFFPIDGQLLGNQGNGNNFHFTYQISAMFGYTPGAGQTFSFSGDDDVWVYFDKTLGIDLGGVHGTAGASVNLDTLFGFGTASAKAAGNYAFDFFFAERHTSGSNLNIETSLELVPNNNSVPEPSALALLAAAMAGLAWTARRGRSSR